MAELFFPGPFLTDGVIALRAWTPDDVAFVVEACQDAELSRYSPAIAFPYRETDALDWFESQAPARLAGSAIDFAVVHAVRGQSLGAVGLHKLSATQLSGAIGYWLAKEARGHGYISRAVRLLARWAFDDLGLARLELTTDPENIASQKVAERCGFQMEGQLRSHLRVLHSGQRRDSLLYSLLPGELRQE